MKFGAVFLGLGLLTFVVLEALWGGVGPCTDISQLVLLILAFSGIVIGGGILLIALPAVIVKRYKEDRLGGVGSLFPKSDKKSDSF